MNYRIIYNDELYHHGVKGMKWGVRHNRKLSGNRKAPKPLSKIEQSWAADFQKKYNMSEAEAQEAARARTKSLKKVAIGTAVVTGAIIGGIAISKYGREYADEVIRKGATLQTVHKDPKIIETGKFYSAKRFTDKIKYKGLFGETPEGPKHRLTVTTTDNMRIAGNKNAEKIFRRLRDTNPEFREAIRKTDTGHMADYREFNTHGLLGNGSYLGSRDGNKAQKIFISELKKLGYSGVADVNDRRFSGFNTHANIYFDTGKLGEVKVHDMSLREVRKAKAAATAMLIGEGMASPYNIAIGGAVAGTELALRSVDNQDEALKKKYGRRKREING